MASVDKRSPLVKNSTIIANPGPYLARVVNNIDPMKMGSLEVELLRPIGNQKDAEQQLFTVRYLSPFYGCTGIEQNGTNNPDFNDTQKSYGFWAVPPDVGVIVMVIFVESDPGQGFWIGCVPDTYMNHMIPGIAASTAVEDSVRVSDDTKWSDTKSRNEVFGETNYLPVGEVNRMQFKKGGDNTPTPNANVEGNKKPIHPIAQHILEQGLLNDPVRGVHSSSVRRESPSNVYGWSTPGPIDKRQGAKKGQIGYKDSKVNKFVSRLGGHCIIMDDGNEKRLRKSRPWEGPSEYADIENGETGGLPYYPEDDAFRIRTRTGHQILLHNSEDLIFICNSRGTAWIEITSNGKIEFYAKDSISFKSDADFNFHTERDLNMHSGRCVNMFSGNSTVINSINDVTVKSDTNIFVQAATDLGLQSANKVALTGDTGLDLRTNRLAFNSSSLDLTVGGNLHLEATGSLELRGANIFATADNELHVVSGGHAWANMLSLDMGLGTECRIETGSDFSLRANGSFAITAIEGGGNLFSKTAMNVESVGQTNLYSGGQLRAKGSEIHLNSEEPDRAASASPLSGGALEAHSSAGGSGNQANIGGGVAGPKELVLFPNPGTGLSICKRVPGVLGVHENECLNPQGVTPAATDNAHPYVPVGTPSGARYSVRSRSDNYSIPGSAGGARDGSFNWGAHRAGRMGPGDFDQSTTGPGRPASELPLYSADWTKDKEFLSKTEEVARAIGVQKEDLLAVFDIESSFRPNADNGSHTGLIQMGDPEAAMVGTSRGALRGMSRVQQLPYVQRYFEKRIQQTGVRPTCAGDVYMLVASPFYIRRGFDETLYAPGSKAWSQNPAWRNPQPNGPVTRRGIDNAIQRHKRRVQRMLGQNPDSGGNQQPNTGGTSPGSAPSQTTPGNNPLSGISPTSRGLSDSQISDAVGRGDRIIYDGAGTAIGVQSRETSAFLDTIRDPRPGEAIPNYSSLNPELNDVRNRR